MYRISYMWYTFVGAMTTILIAGIVTLLVGWSDVNAIDKKLLAPCIRKYFKGPKNTDSTNGSIQTDNKNDKESTL